MDLTPVLAVLLPAMVVLLIVWWRRRAASTLIDPAARNSGLPTSRAKPRQQERSEPTPADADKEVQDVLKREIPAAAPPLQDKPAAPITAAASPRKKAKPQPAPLTPPLEEAAKPPPAPEPVAPPAGPAVSTVNFTAYYPRTAQADTRYSLIAYAHLRSALEDVQKDVARFTDELGGIVPAPRTAKDAAQVLAGQPITMIPDCEGLEFDPPTLTRKWDAPHTRYEFAFKPGAELAGDELHGRISVQIAGIEVAVIKFAIEVISTAGTQPDAAPTAMMRPMTLGAPPNPLATAKLTTSQSASIYRKIFISYSRKDTAVAEAYRLAQLALGNEVFMDTYSIRTGENWQAALAKAIDTADIFQLFWSKHAADSTNVHDEWDYALKYRCPDTGCAEFIRPVYWENPLPVPPPPELSHLNFRFVPLKG